MLKEADSYQGGDEVDGEAGGKVKDALFSRLKRLVKSDYNSKAKSSGAKRRARISTSTPANSSMRMTRRFCRTQSARSSFSTA
jgi:hypothetical protein